MQFIQWLRDLISHKKKLAESKRHTNAQAQEVKEIDQQLVFMKSKPLTLGVEFELALLDRETLKPAHVSEAIIAEVGTPAFKKELFRHMVELTTVDICANVQEAEKQLGDSLNLLHKVVDKAGLLVTGSGRPPTVLLAECQRVDDPRYAYLHEGRKVLNQRFGTLGMHMHIGMESAESCIRYHNFYMHFLPHLIALAASSPFEDGIDTGLASIRPTIAESLPIAGMPYSFATWQEYVHLCHAMFRAKTIRNLKDLWWDLRPSPRFGTLEIRVCDQPSNLTEAMAIVAFVHSLGLWFHRNQSWLEEMPRPNTWRLRENKWRAMRYGIDAEMVMNNLGDTQPVAEDIRKWLDRVKLEYQELGYENYRDTLLMMLEKGNSAVRQQSKWKGTQSLTEVNDLNCQELRAGRPMWETK